MFTVDVKQQFNNNNIRNLITPYTLTGISFVCVCGGRGDSLLTLVQNLESYLFNFQTLPKIQNAREIT